jgi:putative transposase
MEINYPTRKQLRLQNFDYSQAGAYFVTICSFNKKCIFGDITGDQAHLNSLGSLVTETWKELTDIYPFVSLDSWVLMPNHFHGVIWLNDDNPGESLSSIITTFKAVSARRARTVLNRSLYLWQKGFYERIVRNQKDLFRIRQYIKDNPAQWSLDRENPDYKREQGG